MNRHQRNRRGPGFQRVVAAAIVVASAMAPANAQQTSPNKPALERITPDPNVQGAFDGKDPGKKAKDLSGLACRKTPIGSPLDCLVVNDESAFAQRLTIGNQTVTPTKTVQLIGKQMPASAIGAPPSLTDCPGGPGEFKEFDGEAVAFAPNAAGGGAYYIAGSHGCSRNSGKARLSSFLLAQIPVAPSGALSDALLSWKLSDVLRNAQPVATHFGKSLAPDKQGLNIEGIAVTGDRLRLGLRAPSVQGTAFIVSTTIAAVFAPGTTAPPAAVFSLPLGPDAGIRDMTALPDGRLLVLSGPAQDQPNVSYGITLVTLNDAATTADVKHLGWLEDFVGGGERAKAEAIAVVGGDGDALRVLVMFDGIENGGPREYRVRLPR